MRPRHRSVLAVFLSASVLAAMPADAQLASLEPGVRVRLRADGVVPRRVEGTVLARTPDEVAVAVHGVGTVRVPLARLTVAEVSRGRNRQAGALKGLAWGSAAGVAVGIASVVGSEACGPGDAACADDAHSRGHYVAVGTASGALLGTVIGGVIGSREWERLTLPATIALRPARRGVGVVLTRAF